MLKWLGEEVFWQGVVGSIVATVLCTIVAILIPIIRRRMRGVGTDIAGTWRCEWQSSSPNMNPIESELVTVSLRWDGRVQIQAASTATIPWIAIGEFTKDRRHLLLDWTMTKANKGDMAGASLLFVTPSAKYMAGHWYGENLEGEQSFGWSLLYPADGFGVDGQARTTAHEWIRKRLTAIVPGWEKP